MDKWQAARCAALCRAKEWRAKAHKLRAAAVHAHDTTTREQLLMFAEDCEDEAMHEVSDQLVTLRLQ